MAGDQTQGIEQVDDEEIEIDLDEGADGKSPPADPEPKPEPKGDARASAGNDDQGDDDDGPGGDEDHGERRARRREDGRRRRQNRRAYAMQDNLIIQSLTRKLMEQDQVLQQVIGRQTELDLNTAVASRERAEREYRRAQAEYAKAVEDGRGLDAVRAQEIMDGARQRYNYFGAQIERTREARQQPQRPQAQPQAEGDPAEIERVTANNRRNFLARNSWVDLDSDDEDIQILKEIDAEIAAEGLKPEFSDYWIELERRIKEEGLGPHRKKQRQDDPPPREHHSQRQPREEDGKFTAPQRRGPPTGGRGGSGAGNKVRVPGEVVKALKEAGAWDDIPRRNRLIAEWQQRSQQK